MPVEEFSKNRRSLEIEFEAGIENQRESEEIAKIRDKEEQEQKELLKAVLSTIEHFFRFFQGMVKRYNRPARPY